MVEQLSKENTVILKQSLFKKIIKGLFMKPPFIGEIILALLLILAIVNTMKDTVSINNLGTICSSIANEAEIKEYKSSIANKMMTDLELQGITIQSMNLTEEELENYAGVNLIKLKGDDEGKNLINGIELIRDNGNSSDIYNYLNANNEPIEVEYSYFYTMVNRKGVRYYARIGDLLKKGVRHGSPLDISMFNSMNYGDNIEMPISNLADPFLLKQSIPLYLYSSTYSKEIAESFINNNVFDSEIKFQKHNIQYGSHGIEEENIENCKVAELILNDGYELEQLKELKKDIKINGNVIYMTLQRKCNENYVLLHPELFTEDMVYLGEAVYFDREGWLHYQKDNSFVLENYEEEVGQYTTLYVAIPNDGFTEPIEKTIGNIADALSDAKLDEATDAESLSLKEIGDKVWVKEEEDGKYSLYERFNVPYYTAATGDMDIYLLQSAKTWFGNFYFTNSVNSNASMGEIDFERGKWNGTEINTTCRYEVNEEARNAILDLFNYGETDSSLADLNLWATFIERNAIENDDYNLKLTYYGLCRMFENVEGINILYNDEIEKEFGNVDNIQIATVPDYAYNILQSAINLPAPYPLASTVGMTTASLKADGEFREFTSPYGACYRKNFPTETLSLFTDLGRASGFTLEDFYKMGERFAEGRFNNLKNYGYNDITEQENLEYCLKLAETCYNLEQDIGINGILILGMATKEGGWGASSFSVEDGNLWGYGVRDTTNGTINFNDCSKIYPEEMDKKYKEDFQKCAYQYACYLKTRYLRDNDYIIEYLQSLEVDESDKVIINKTVSDLKNLKLEEIKNTGNNLTEEEFNKLISYIEDEDVMKSLKAYRYWNGVYSSDEFGGFYKDFYGPTLYTIDGTYVRGWQYENKEYATSTYTCMLTFYNVIGKGGRGGGSYTEGDLTIKEISSNLVDVNGEKYKTVTKVDLIEFLEYISSNRVSQNSNSKYSDSCMSFAYSYVYYLEGLTSRNLTAANCAQWRYAGNYRRTQSKDRELILEIIYNELVNVERPLIIQVTRSGKRKWKIYKTLCCMYRNKEKSYN